MKSTAPRTTARRGAALVFALAVVLVASVLIMTVLATATQHYNLARVQVDHAAALDLAEGGMNWQINQMNFQAAGGSAVIYSAAPYSGPLPGPGVDRPAAVPDPPSHRVRFQVQQRTTTSERWYSPLNFRLWAEATVFDRGDGAGATRRIEAEGRPVTAWDLNRLFSLHDMRLRGDSLQVEGSIGCAGDLEIRADPAILTGTVNFDVGPSSTGRWASDPKPWDTLASAMPSPYLDVNTIARRTIGRRTGVPPHTIANPLLVLAANNDNLASDAGRALIRTRDPATGKLGPINWDHPTKGRLPADRIDRDLWDANPGKNIVLFGRQDKPPGMPAFRMGSDFYFTEVELSRTGQVLEIQNGWEKEDSATWGAVRIWIGPEGGTGGPIDLTRGRIRVHCGASNAFDVRAFVIYNGTRRTLRIGGDLEADAPPYAGLDMTGYFGMLYCMNARTDWYGSLEILPGKDGFTLRGSAVAWDIEHRGGPLRMPALRRLPLGTEMRDPFAPVLFYSIDPNWWVERESTRYSAAPGAR